MRLVGDAGDGKTDAMRVPGFAASLALRLFPPRCALCDEPTRDLDLCDGCLGDLPLLGMACPACAGPVTGGIRYCGRCTSRSPPMQLTVAPFRYDFPMDWLLTRLKFHGRLWHGPLLAALIAEYAARRLPDGGVLVPVPLHHRRLARRGYNQATEIARPLALYLRRGLDVGLVSRERRTREQSKLSARERRRNVSGAFRLMRQPEFTHAIIVDDVVTTGATSRELAKLLRRAGCEQVSVVAVARAV